MKEDIVHCSKHRAMFEYICTHCNTILCSQCLASHSKHKESNEKKYLVHLLRHAKSTLCSFYENTINKLESSLENKTTDVQLETLKGRVSKMIQSTKEKQNHFKEVTTSFEITNKHLELMLNKIRFTQNSKNELALAKRELQILKEALTSSNILTIIRILRNDSSVLNKPQLLDNECNAMNDALKIFEDCSTNSLNSAIEATKTLFRDIKSIENTMKTIKHNNSYACKEPDNINTEQTFEEKLSKAIETVSINDVYKTFRTIGETKMEQQNTLNTCMNIARGMNFMISHAIQQRKIKPNSSIYPVIRIYYENLNPKKDVQKLNKFKDISMHTIIESDIIGQILRKTLINEQIASIQRFTKETPKDIHKFSKQSLEQYLEYMNYKTKLAITLRKQEPKRPEWVDTLLNIDSILPLLYYVNQISTLDEVTDSIAKSISIPKGHVAIVRLTSYAMCGRWDNFAKYVSKKSPKLPAEFLAGVCIDHGNNTLAKEYIKKISNYETKLDKLMEINEYIEAVEVAVGTKKPQAIEYLKTKTILDLDPYIKEAERKLIKK